jgi:hypothetical protein
MGNGSLELVAIEFTVENHTLLHEAEFAGRIKIAAGTLRFNQMEFRLISR